MAEGLALHWLRERGLQERFSVGSRSVSEDFEPVGSEPSAHAVDFMAEGGIDISAHRSQLLSEEDADSAVAIVGITARHAAKIASMFPASKHKLVGLEQDVPDPWHQKREAYVACGSLLRTLVANVMTQITSSGKRTP